MLHLIIDILRNSVLITGIVTIMMLMIESFNLESHRGLFSKVKDSSLRQVVLAALLGSVPGCIGGFAAVSLYTSRLLSFGALIAMMVASSGDEAFVIMAMMPDKALWIFAILFVIAVVSGLIVDSIVRKKSRTDGRDKELAIQSDEHRHDCHSCGTEGKRSLTLKRVIMTVCVLLFAVALVAGWFGHSHSSPDAGKIQINLLSEWWMNVLFAALSIIMLVILCFRNDRFIDEILWKHTVRKHLPNIFAWTFGVLLVIGILGEYVDLNRWVSGNTAVMILLAVAIGIIPESGPHLIFVTLYASGLVPLPVLLASSISQDGHSTLPLLAEDKKSFAYAKLTTCIIALAVGYGAMLLS